MRLLDIFSFFGILSSFFNPTLKRSKVNRRETDIKNITVKDYTSSALSQGVILGFSRVSLLAAFRELGGESPYLGGFAVPVNYDDPRWSVIQRDSYAYVDPDLKAKHFPIGRHGTSGVVVEYVTLDHDSTFREALAEITRRRLRVPDRAEAESFLDEHPEEQKKLPIVGLCGAVKGWRGSRHMRYVVADVGGRRSLGCERFVGRWVQYVRFLAVRPA